MGFLSNLFGNSNNSPINNASVGNLQILLKHIKKDSSWVSLIEYPTSSLYVDKVSCYVEDDGSLFFLWRDVHAEAGDVFYFTLVKFNIDNTQLFYVLKQIKQIKKGSEQYNFQEDGYSINSEDANVQKIIACAKGFAYENSFKEPPEYVDGLS